MWHKHRRPRWSYRLLNLSDREIGALDGVSGGSVTVNATTRLGGSATLSMDDRGQEIDWLSDRVQVVYDPGIVGVEAWPVGTFLFTSPTEKHVDGRVSYEVSLLSKMVVIDEDTVEDSYSLPAGTPVIETVGELIRSTGEDRISITPSDTELQNSMRWDAGESKLTIINDLLDAAGYWSLWCDGAGQYRVEPYVLPADRPTSWVFAAGETSIHKPEWDREQDKSSVPNKVVVRGEGDGEEPGLVAVAVNEDPESEFSVQARGRVITKIEEGAEGDQDVLDRLAQRRLVDAMSPLGKLTVLHAIVPYSPNDVVEFVDSGIDVRASVQSVTYKLVAEGHADAVWREL